MRRILLVSSILAGVMLCILLYSLKPEENLNRQTAKDQTLVIWTSSPTTVDIANEFQQENDHIEVVTRLVDDPQMLLEELSIAESAGQPPHIAEIPSFYGLSSLVDSGALVQVEQLLDEELKENLVQSMEKRFTYDGKLWAIPLGYEIPLLYINENVVPKDKVGSTIIDIFTNGKWVQENNNNIWGMNSDTLYPWYMLNLLKEEGLEDTQVKESLWYKARDEYGLLPPYTDHLAITQFVNGKGGILLSTSRNIWLFEKLIGTKFKWSTSQFPIDPKNMIPNGNGLVVMKETASEDVVSKFISYILQDEELEEYAKKENLIPAYKKNIKSSAFLKEYRQYPGYQKAILDSLEAEGEYPSVRDDEVWEKLKKSDKNLMEQG
ncbi:sugar ABC transporter substrate-binding protein [Bacillus sp. REN16]|uniref:sugar ABC transporter substrate-binding protein n=1 Tax=Bacillus sp. REN16 TaxID=2887296 RepID=UPI001E3C4B63|nr:extracellular solute-binding protein [Bacillus sp. REN16]MCC3356100.1 extracellular solute-binding protein [Bacillus sp. REN16]